MRVLLLLLLSLPAWAGVGLKFESAPAVDVLRTIYIDVLKESVIVTNAALQEPARVSVEIPDISPKDLRERARQIAASASLDVQSRAGVVIIDRKHDAAVAAHEFTVYRPRYRSVPYLVELLQPLFPRGAFTQQRGIDEQSIKPDATQEVTQGSALSKFDRDADVLVFSGTASDIDRFYRAVVQLDVVTPEILVKAVVFEVTTDDEHRNAIQLAASILGGRLGIQIGRATGGEFSAVFGSSNFTAVFDALSADRRFKTVTAPTMRVRSGAQAKLTVGKEVPTISGNTIDRNGNAINQVTYRPSGVILDLRPQVRDGEIDLSIAQQISDFVTTTTGVNNSPTLIKRELSTRVGLKSSDVVVLGGLDQSQETAEKRGLSFLPDFMASKSGTGSKTEIMLLLSAERI